MQGWSLVRHIDWVLVGAVFLLIASGLVTMNSFVGENYFFERQVVFAGIGFVLFLLLSFVDFRFLRRTSVVITIFAITTAALAFIFVVGEVALGAQSRFDLGFFVLQPSELAKLVLIILLAKYFSRRHIEIGHVRHILVSGLYTAILFILVLLQPDFGSAIIILSVWLGMIIVSGVSKKHLAIVALTGILIGTGMWFYGFAEYQKERILTFIHPLTDIQGAGYNAYQSTIAVGSGETLGKGIGFGTQSKLEFLPEYETDFIFAAFAEEWGFVGSTLLLIVFSIVLWRITQHAMRGATNFETLFGAGVAILFASHIVIHVGMNIGLLPVTGTTIPFMSYGGSHLLTEFIALGMVMGMRRYAQVAHPEDIRQEFLGI